MILRRFARDWERSRPTPRSRRDRVGQETLSAVGYLVETTARMRVPVHAETVERVLSGRSSLTELRVADALVAAVGCPEAFHDGTLSIVENPRGPRAARGECCGGSS